MSAKRTSKRAEVYGTVNTYRGWLVKYNKARGTSAGSSEWPHDTAISRQLERDFPEYYRQYYYNHRLSKLTNPDRPEPKGLGSMFTAPSPKPSPKPTPTASPTSRPKIQREYYRTAYAIAYQPHKHDEINVRDARFMPESEQSRIGKAMGEMVNRNARPTPSQRARKYPGVIGAFALFQEWDYKVEHQRKTGLPAHQRVDSATLKDWRAKRTAAYTAYRAKYDRALKTEQDRERVYKAAQRKASPPVKKASKKMKPATLTALGKEWQAKRNAYMEAARAYRDNPTPANEQRARTARDAFRAIDREEEAKHRKK